MAMEFLPNLQHTDGFSSPVPFIFGLDLTNFWGAVEAESNLPKKILSSAVFDIYDY